MKWLLDTILTCAGMFDPKFLSLVNPNAAPSSEPITEAQWTGLMNYSGNSPVIIDFIWLTEQK